MPETKPELHWTAGPFYMNRKLRREIELNWYREQKIQIREEHRESMEERRERLAAERRIRLDVRNEQRGKYYA